MSRRSFCRSPDDFFAVAKSRSLYSRESAGGRPRERMFTATPPSRRTVRPAPRAASRTRRPSATMSAWGSEEADGPPLFVDVDGVGGRGSAVARHRLHVTAERDEPARAGVGADVAHGDCEPGRRVRKRRVVREREVRLRHADRELVEADALDLIDLLARRGLQEDPVASVDTRHDRLDLALDRVVERIDRGEARRLLGRSDDGLGERCRALAALDDRLVRLGRDGAVGKRNLADLLDLLVRVRGETVDGDDGVEAELA